MLRLRGAAIRIGVVDNIVEPKPKLRMLAESAKCFRHRPIRVEDREDVAHTGVTVPTQIFNAADSNSNGAMVSTDATLLHLKGAISYKPACPMTAPDPKRA
jgi:hypothetical protein